MTSVEEVDGTKSIEAGILSSSTADKKKISVGKYRLSPPSQTRAVFFKNRQNPQTYGIKNYDST